MFSSVKVRRYCVLVIHSSVCSDLPDLKQICTSNLPRDDICQSHLATDILHPDKRHLGVLGNQKTAAPRKACCWLWRCFSACIKAKTTTWVLGDPRQLSAIHCVCSVPPGIEVVVQQSQRFPWHVQAWKPPELMDLMGCKGWKCVLDTCWWNHIRGQIKERAAPNTIQLQFSLAILTSWFWNFWVGTNNDHCEPPLIGKLSLQALQCIQQPMRSAY